VGKIKNKLKDRKGTALILVIFVMLMITAGVGIVSLQVNNQIISNKNRSNKSEQTYLAEAGVEKTIADIYEAIESKLKDLNKVTEPKTYADKYVVYCLKESQKYFIRANENMPEAHKDIINSQILKVYTDEELIKNAVAPYTNTSSSINKVLNGVNNLKSQVWYNGVANNYKKGIASNIDMGVYYLSLAKQTLGHMSSTSHTPHVEYYEQDSGARIIKLSPNELMDINNYLSTLKSKLTSFVDDNSKYTGDIVPERYKDGTLTSIGVLRYINENLDIKNEMRNNEVVRTLVNNKEVTLNDILGRLGKLRSSVLGLQPGKSATIPSTTPIGEIEKILKASKNELPSINLLTKATAELSQYSNIIENFQEGSGKNKLVTKSEVITDITNIKAKLNSINVDSSDKNAILKLLNESLDELVQLQVDVSSLKPKGNLSLPSVSEIDNIKKYLIEIKCNLSNPDYMSITDTVTEGPLNASSEAYTIIIPAGTYKIEGKDAYKRDSIEFQAIAIRDRYVIRNKATNVIISEVYNIREIRPTTVDILAYDSNDKNKVKANVTFYTEILNNGSKFTVYDHKVNSWDR
jgi:hypothetical protein